MKIVVTLLITWLLAMVWEPLGTAFLLIIICWWIARGFARSYERNIGGH